MPAARQTFESSIKDAVQLLDHFNAINALRPPANAEELRRAGLIMPCTVCTGSSTSKAGWRQRQLPKSVRHTTPADDTQAVSQPQRRKKLQVVFRHLGRECRAI